MKSLIHRKPLRQAVLALLLFAPAVPGFAGAVLPQAAGTQAGTPGISQLPPMAPSVLKQTDPPSAVPPLPGPLPTAVGRQGAAPIVRQAPPAAGGSVASGAAATPRRAAALPPGPLTSTPMGIAVTPGEVRVSGLG
jgi:hypothetical protein